jgi:hypothetical protein
MEQAVDEDMEQPEGEYMGQAVFEDMEHRNSQKVGIWIRQ